MGFGCRYSAVWERAFLLHGGVGDGWFANQEGAEAWLLNGIPEQVLVSDEGKELRADLITPYKGGYLVLDYKTGEPRPGYMDQIREYMRILSLAEPDASVYGALVYLDKKKFMGISQDGHSELTDTLHVPGLKND